VAAGNESYRYFKSPPTNIFKKLSKRNRTPSEQQVEPPVKDTIFTNSSNCKKQMSFAVREDQGSVQHDSNRSEEMKHDANIFNESYEDEN